MEMPRPGRFRIGPSGWSYDDWAGLVYPQRRPRGFQPLRHIAELFNAVEVNASFYRVPSAAMTERWPEQVPTDFRFAFKLTQDFTHRRAEFPAPAVVAAFQDALRPLRESGRLGPVLAQFPWSFRFSEENAAWLERVRAALPEDDLFVEVRHASWASAAGLAAIRAVGGVCNIDQPQLRDCLGPTAHAFGPRAYVRLHGRNAAHWFAEGQPAYERYNYLYSTAELQEWAARLRALAAQTEEVYVFANNHFRAQSVVNALELRATLEGRQALVPVELLRAYPRLTAIARPAGQAELFD
jgi:uncharacterized protein YecE (DUF72 family)